MTVLAFLGLTLGFTLIWGGWLATEGNTNGRYAWPVALFFNLAWTTPAFFGWWGVIGTGLSVAALAALGGLKWISAH